MKKILFFLAMSASIVASAQSTENPNIKAQKEMEKKGYAGHATYKLDQIHSVNINYSITPKVPTDKINVMLHTSETTPVGLYIANLQGKKLLTFSPNKEAYIKEGELNVASLKSGKYVYVIYWNEDTVLEIPFEKK